MNIDFSEDDWDSGKYLTQDVACGSLHALLSSKKGKILSTGFGGTYALGHGNNTTIDRFKEIEFFSDNKFENQTAKILKCGVSHSIAFVNKKVNLFDLGIWETRAESGF